MRRQPHPDENVVRKLQELSKRLEEGLFKSGQTKVDLSPLSFTPGVSEA